MAERARDSIPDEFRSWAESVEKNSPIWDSVEEMVHIGAWALDIASGAVSWTRGVYMIYGVEPGDVTEKEAALSYYELEDQDRLRAAIEAATDEQRPYDLTCRLRRKDGTRRVVRTSGKPLLADGRVIRLAGVIQDITEQHTLEQMLRESERNFHEIVDSVDAVFWVRSRDLNQLLYVSDSYETKYRNSIEEAYRNPSSFLDNIHVDDRPTVAAADAEYRKTFHMDMEYRVWRRDNSIAWVNARSYPIYDEAGTVVRHVGIAIDITKRKQYEELLERQHALQQIVSTISTNFIQAPVGSVDAEISQALELLAKHFDVDRGYVFRFSEDQTRASTSHEWCRDGVQAQIQRMQNIRIDDYSWWAKRILRDDYVFVPRVNDLPVTAEREREELAAQDIQSLLEVPIATESGIIGFIGFDSVRKHYDWQQWEIDLVRMAANAIAGAVERAARERSVLEARDRAETATRAKSEFLARMSHELRTPLNAVIGFSDLLSTTPLTDRQQKYLSSVLVSAASLSRIINDILDFSVMEADSLSMEYIPVSVRDLVDQSASQVSLDVRRKALEFDSQIAEDVPETILSDPVRLKQILVNLLTNAVKFTDSGFVRLRVSVEDEARTLLCTVSDSGIGIEQSKQDLVFDSFSQADGSNTRVYGGSGLGLAIARGLTERMGGTISVESQIRKGSVFSVRLPLVLPETPARAAASTSRSTVHTDYRSETAWRILLAEDNALNSVLARELIRTVAPNADVFTVTNGKEAVAACAERYPDIVLMDVQMPVMDGHEATRLIRASALPHQPYIIALTAGASDDDRKLSLEAGMDAHLSKPIMRASLYAALEHAPVPEPATTSNTDTEQTTDRTGEQHMTLTSIVETLQSRGHSPDTIDEVLSLLRERVPELLSSIGAALEQSDYVLLSRDAHAAKGIFRTLLLEELGEAAHRLERAAKEEDHKETAAAADTVLSQLALLQKEL